MDVDFTSTACPLCDHEDVAYFAREAGRDFGECRDCGLIFVDPSLLPSTADERARYETHNNRADDAGYVRFLSQLKDEILHRVAKGARGLDYGSGPAPVMAGLLEGAGHQTAIYDPFFAPDPSVLTRSYDFISCCETAEHFHHPGREFDRLDALLAPGGILGVMTQMLEDDADFEGWWYVKDATHVCFYRPRTMAWVARRFGWRWERAKPAVSLFLKPRQ